MVPSNPHRQKQQAYNVNRFFAISPDIGRGPPPATAVPLPETPQRQPSPTSSRRFSGESSITTATSLSTASSFDSTKSTAEPEESIFVTNLPLFMTNADLEARLRTTFEPAGKILNVKIVNDTRKAGNQCAFIQFETVENARDALSKIQYPEIDGNRLRCELARAHRSLLVSFRPDFLLDGGREIHTVRLWKVPGLRDVQVSFNDEAIEGYFSLSNLSRSSCNSLYGQGVLLSVDRPQFPSEQIIRSLTMAFGPIEYSALFRADGFSGAFDPHPMPPRVGEPFSPGQSRDYLGPWEVKFERRCDAMTAYTTLNKLPFLYITRTHAHMKPANLPAVQPSPGPVRLPQVMHDPSRDPRRRPQPSQEVHSHPVCLPPCPGSNQLSGLGLWTPASDPTGLPPPSFDGPPQALPKTPTRDLPPLNPPPKKKKVAGGPKAGKRSTWTPEVAAKLRQQQDVGSNVPASAPVEDSKPEEDLGLSVEMKRTTAAALLEAAESLNLGSKKEGGKSRNRKGNRASGPKLQLDRRVLFVPHSKKTDWSNEKLIEVFARYEGLLTVECVTEIVNKETKWNGVVYFDSEEHATNASKGEVGKQHFGTKIKILVHRRDPEADFPPRMDIPKPRVPSPVPELEQDVGSPVEETSPSPEPPKARIAALDTLETGMLDVLASAITTAASLLEDPAEVEEDEVVPDGVTEPSATGLPTPISLPGGRRFDDEEDETESNDDELVQQAYEDIGLQIEMEEPHREPAVQTDSGSDTTVLRSNTPRDEEQEVPVPGPRDSPPQVDEAPEMEILHPQHPVSPIPVPSFQALRVADVISQPTSSLNRSVRSSSFDIVYQPSERDMSDPWVEEVATPARSLIDLDTDAWDKPNINADDREPELDGAYSPSYEEAPLPSATTYRHGRLRSMSESGASRLRVPSARELRASATLETVSLHSRPASVADGVWNAQDKADEEYHSIEVTQYPTLSPFTNEPDLCTPNTDAGTIDETATLPAWETPPSQPGPCFVSPPPLLGEDPSHEHGATPLVAYLPTERGTVAIQLNPDATWSSQANSYPVPPSQPVPWGAFTSEDRGQSQVPPPQPQVQTMLPLPQYYPPAPAPGIAYAPQPSPPYTTGDAVRPQRGNNASRVSPTQESFRSAGRGQSRQRGRGRASFGSSQPRDATGTRSQVAPNPSAYVPYPTSAAFPPIYIQEHAHPQPQPQAHPHPQPVFYQPPSMYPYHPGAAPHQQHQTPSPGFPAYPPSRQADTMPPSYLPPPHAQFPATYHH